MVELKIFLKRKQAVQVIVVLMVLVLSAKNLLQLSNPINYLNKQRVLEEDASRSPTFYNTLFILIETRHNQISTGT
jgi:hypothetical protein